MLHKYPELFQDPHIDYPINNLNLHFSDYISQIKQIIATHRVDLNHNANRVIEANAPYELPPIHPVSKYGVLLIHGLFDSPFVMKDIGKTLQSQGMLVRSILLPGHGTVPGSLLNITYEDWLQAVRYGIATLAKEVEKIILVGFSTGAALSIHHALHHPAQIAGIVALSPALKINSPFAFATNWHQVTSWAWPRARWFYITQEIDYTKYCSMTFNAVYQVYKLTQEIKKMDSSRKLSCPLFMALSYDDLVICSRSAIKYFCGLSNPHNKMLLYKNGDLNKNDPRILVQDSTIPELKIRNYSHISLPVAPDNPHYGKHGDYPLASHVEEDNDIFYGAFNKPRALLNHVLYQMKLTKYPLQRLTFNPSFDDMMKEMGEWILECRM